MCVSMCLCIQSTTSIIFISFKETWSGSRKSLSPSSCPPNVTSPSNFCKVQVHKLIRQERVNKSLYNKMVSHFPNIGVGWLYLNKQIYSLTNSVPNILTLTNFLLQVVCHRKEVRDLKRKMSKSNHNIVRLRSIVRKQRKCLDEVHVQILELVWNCIRTNTTLIKKIKIASKK